MLRLIRDTQVFLCLVFVSAVAAQPIVTSRIQSVKADGAGQIEIRVVSERAGAFDPNGDSPPAFNIRENGVRQESLRIETLPPQNDTSRTVILADLSLSLTPKQFASFKRAAVQFIDKLKPGDLAGLVTFERRVFRELNFTADHALLKKRIQNLKQRGRRTMLYDALIEAHKMLDGATERKAILVYTDGRENASRVRFDDVIELYTANPVPLFVASRHSSAALKRLIRLARVSGGDAFRAEDGHDLIKVFGYLTRLKAETYRLNYKTQAKAGSTIDIEIETGSGQNLVRSYTLPTDLPASMMGSEKLFSLPLAHHLRTHMPEILLSLIVLLLVAVIIMLFFRRQEINVKIENMQPPALITERDIMAAPGKKHDLGKAKLPLDYHHGWLVEKEGPHTGRKYKINWHVVTLGFSDDNSIVIEDNTVSQRHARIERDGKNFVLYDLLSESGTYLNGKKLLRPKELSDFDEIGLGRTKLIFRKGTASTAMTS